MRAGSRVIGALDRVGDSPAITGRTSAVARSPQQVREALPTKDSGEAGKITTSWLAANGLPPRSERSTPNPR